MAGKRYDIITGREDKNGKTHWTKIGAAFERDNGGFNLTFDALPIADANGCRAMMVEPKARDNRDDVSRRDTRRDDHSDEIPF